MNEEIETKITEEEVNAVYEMRLMLLESRFEARGLTGFYRRNLFLHRR